MISAARLPARRMIGTRAASAAIKLVAGGAKLKLAGGCAVAMASCCAAGYGPMPSVVLAEGAGAMDFLEEFKALVFGVDKGDAAEEQGVAMDEEGARPSKGGANGGGAGDAAAAPSERGEAAAETTLPNTGSAAMPTTPFLASRTPL